ncbi:hypothetical protein [Citrobacter braakii]|uniref:hypothetical protein n=1 Tax=Citrobacter braakii TaxID=57706 RepID=UPI003979ADD7
MSKDNFPLDYLNRDTEWMTIREAIKTASKSMSKKIKDYDIYRHSLYGNIYLSVYFQSPIILRKVAKLNNKIKFRPLEGSLFHRVCMLDNKNFLNGGNLIPCTEGEYFSPTGRIIDTTLTGYEYVLVQRLLAHSLSLPSPVTGANKTNHGITVNISGDIFQVFEKITWEERIKNQLTFLPENISSDINKYTSTTKFHKNCDNEYFPAYDLPQDACFVIKNTELEKLINLIFNNTTPLKSSVRISTPLSRLFWLACKHNETISPLMKQPYKLLSIFEQWASTDGITDHLSGDTLKTALERGSPTSI